MVVILLECLKMHSESPIELKAVQVLITQSVYASDAFILTGLEYALNIMTLVLCHLYQFLTHTHGPNCEEKITWIKRFFHNLKEKGLLKNWSCVLHKYVLYGTQNK